MWSKVRIRRVFYFTW